MESSKFMIDNIRKPSLARYILEFSDKLLISYHDGYDMRFYVLTKNAWKWRSKRRNAKEKELQRIASEISEAKTIKRTIDILWNDRFLEDIFNKVGLSFANFMFAYTPAKKSKSILFNASGELKIFGYIKIPNSQTISANFDDINTLHYHLPSLNMMVIYRADDHYPVKAGRSPLLTQILQAKSVTAPKPREHIPSSQEPMSSAGGFYDILIKKYKISLDAYVKQCRNESRNVDKIDFNNFDCTYASFLDISESQILENTNYELKLERNLWHEDGIKPSGTEESPWPKATSGIVTGMWFP